MDLEELLAKQLASQQSTGQVIKKDTRPSACAKCGYSGHLTFQCRNFIPTQANKEMLLDVSSTSSDSSSSTETTTPLTKLRAEELKQKLKELKKKSKKKKSKKKKTKRRHSSSDEATPPKKRK